jgi:hypothetical protein
VSWTAAKVYRNAHAGKRGLWVVPNHPRRTAHSMRNLRFPSHYLVLTLLPIAGCTPVPPAQAPRPYPTGHYDYSPEPPCRSSGSAALTLAIVAPTWQGNAKSTAAASPTGTLQSSKVISDLADAMKGDFLELVTCRGYLVRGPFDSFDAMVYPDREASQLLLEPQLELQFRIVSITQDNPDVLTSLLNKTAPTRFRGVASVGGRVTLTLKEPITNTRMWTRSIEVPYDTAQFVTDGGAPWSVPYSPEQMGAMAMADPGFGQAVIPKLEVIYQHIFRTAESYLNAHELATVAAQAVPVRKRGVIANPAQR